MTDAASGRGPGEKLPAAPAAAARERVVALLSRHFANDELTHEEFERRLDLTYRAATPAELDAVLVGLPALPEPATAAAAAVEPPRLARIRALFSGQERRSAAWAVPRRLEVSVRAGYVELDLTRATFAPGLTEIDVSVFMGYTEIFFPPGVRVENEGGAVLGYFAVKGGAASEAAGSPAVVRVTGRAVLGYVECFLGSGKRKRLGA